MPETVHQHKTNVKYFRVGKGKNKRKEVSTKQAEPEAQESRDEQATQVQETEQVPPLGQESEQNKQMKNKGCHHQVKRKKPPPQLLRRPRFSLL